MANRERKTELSWLNVAFCAMVLVIHCLSYPISELPHESGLFAVSFAVQRLLFVSVFGFFLLSGIKLTLPRDGGPMRWGAYYWGRCKSILFPYALAVLVYYVWFACIRHYFPPRADDFFGYLLRGDLSAPFYFVIALAQFILLAPLFSRLSERVDAHFTLPLAHGISALSIHFLPAFLAQIGVVENFAYGDRIFTAYLFFFLFGCYIGREYDSFLKLVRRARGFLLAAAVLFGALDVFFAYRAVGMGLSVPFAEEMHLLWLYAALPLCFLAAEALPRRLPPLLARIDRASYLIFLYHALFLSVFDYLIGPANIQNTYALLALRLAVVFFAVPAAACGWQALVRCLKNKLVKRSQGVSK